MIELIKIVESNGQKAVSARELHTFLDATERFSAWIERQFQYGFVENIDFVGCKVFNTLANQELQDFALALDCAKEISMLQKSEKGKQARLYFIEFENKFKPLMPATYLDALKALVISEEAKLLAEVKILELEPKAEVYDKISNADNLLSLNDAAKSIGVGRNSFMQQLRYDHILQPNNQPYQRYIDDGYFAVKINPIKMGDKTVDIPVTKVTAKGLTWLSKKY